MEAGRELDCLIEEKVFGNETYLFENTLSAFGITTDVKRYQIKNSGTPGCSKWSDKSVPNYSTDIGAAWEVVEKLNLWVWPHEGGWIAGRPEDEGYFSVTETYTTIDHTYDTVIGTTAPHAICLAALRSVPVL